MVCVWACVPELWFLLVPPGCMTTEQNAMRILAQKTVLKSAGYFVIVSHSRGTPHCLGDVRTRQTISEVSTQGSCIFRETFDFLFSEHKAHQTSGRHVVYKRAKNIPAQNQTDSRATCYVKGLCVGCNYRCTKPENWVSEFSSSSTENE